MISYILINPKAGMLKGYIEPAAVKEKLKGLKLDPVIFVAKANKGILSFIAAVKKDKPQVVLIAGGDGTIATIIKALKHQPVTFGLIPTGSMNNISQSIGLGDELEESIEVINRGHTDKMDLGMVNNKVFVESVGIGLLANVMARVGEQDTKKEVLKVARHTIGEMLNSDPIHVVLRADDRELTVDTTWLTVTNTGRAAAAMVDPTSNATDRQIELVYCEPLRRSELSRYVVAFIRNAHLQEKKFHHLRAKSLKIKLPKNTEVHVDGELMKATQLNIKLLAGAIKVFVP